VFGMVGVDVEIHYGRTPAHMESVSVLVPRGDAAAGRAGRVRRGAGYQRLGSR